MTPSETPHVPVLPSPRFFFATAIAAGLFFAVWSWLRPGETIEAFDKDCAYYWFNQSKANPSPLEFMVFLTELGGIAAMTLLAIMGAIWQTAINHRFLAIAWLGVVIGGAILNVSAKTAFDRARPPPEIRASVVHESNQSYPSGHSMGSAIGYGILGYALVLPQRRRPRRVGAVLLLTCVVLAIGFSRIYLRAHWFSDVVAGWSIGMCWMFFCIGCLEWRRRRLYAAKVAAVGEPR